MGLEAELGLEAVPPFHPDLVVGVGTYALELFDAAGPLDTVYVPVGMGSGICGLIGVRDLLGLPTEIVGVVSDRAPATALSFEAGEVVDDPRGGDLRRRCRLPGAGARGGRRDGPRRRPRRDGARGGDRRGDAGPAAHHPPAARAVGRHRAGRAAGRARAAGAGVASGSSSPAATVTRTSSAPCCPGERPPRSRILTRMPSRARRRWAAPVAGATLLLVGLTAACSADKPHCPHDHHHARPPSTPTPTPHPDRSGSARRRAGARRQDRQHICGPTAHRARRRRRRLRRTGRGRAHQAAGRLQPQAAAEVGPVRSGRESDVDLVANYGKVALAFSGSSSYTKRILDKGRQVNLSFDQSAAATTGTAPGPRPTTSSGRRRPSSPGPAAASSRPTSASATARRPAVARAATSVAAKWPVLAGRP